MANQNLSQFGENTSVSDADYTFVWDSAASISKKVSRNSWLNSGTLTSDAPVTISQTWNAVGQTFKALVVNAAGTSDANSASGSLLADFQVGGVSKAWVTKQGGYRASNGQFVSGNGIGFAGGLNTGFYSVGGEQIYVAANNNVPIEFRSTSIVVNSAAIFGFGTVGVGADTILLRDSASGNTLALRNGAAAQTFNVYGTSSASNANYARLALTCGLDGNATISTQALGTGTAGTVSINGVPVGLGKANNADSIAIGTSAINSSATGAQNVAIGKNTLRDAIGSSSSVAIGYEALRGGGSQTVAIGWGAAIAGPVNNSISLGWASLYSSQATNVIALGTSSGRFIANGSTDNAVTTNSIFIGPLTKAAASGETNQIVIGYDATGIGSNSVVLGNDSITKTALKGNVGIGTTAPVAKLHITGGDASTDFNAATIALGFGTTGEYRHFIHTRHAGTAANNFIDFYTSSGVASGVYPTNAVHGMTINNGSVGIGTTSPSSKLHVAGDVTLPNGGSIFFGGGFNIYGTTSATTINGPTAFGQVAVSVNGATKWVFNYDGLFCGGGTTAAFPALKRSSTTMQARLADDTAFAPIQGKLTTDTAFTATTVTPTGFITLYDSTGAAYKVPCVPA